ncbi:MAG: hypothetical protein RI996_515 [Candidatus Parcubacteria bacterium]|jgi:hypothetical protein
MGELFQKLILLIVGLFFVMYFSKIIFAQYNVADSFKSIGSSLAEIRKLGQSTSTSNTTYTNSQNDDKRQSSTGAEKSISLGNLFRGNVVSPSEPINGLAPATWFYQGISTARFLDEGGKQIGVAQMVQQGDLKATGQVPFIVTPQFSQGNAQTGFVVFEKVNTSSDTKKDAWFTLPITYPIKNAAATSSWQGNTYNTGNSFSGTPNNTNTLGSGSAIPAPQR